MDPVTLKLISNLEATVSKALSFVDDTEYTVAYKTIFKLGFTPKCVAEPPPLHGSSVEAGNIRRGMNDLIKRSMKEEIDFTVDEKWNCALKSLEDMKVGQQFSSTSTKQWRPPGKVSSHTAPFRLASKIEAKNQLLQQVMAERERLKILVSRLISKRKRAVDLSSHIQEQHRIIIKNVTLSKFGEVL